MNKTYNWKILALASVFSTLIGITVASIAFNEIDRRNTIESLSKTGKNITKTQNGILKIYAEIKASQQEAFIEQLISQERIDQLFRSQNKAHKELVVSLEPMNYYKDQDRVLQAINDNYFVQGETIFLLSILQDKKLVIAKQKHAKETRR